MSVLEKRIAIYGAGAMGTVLGALLINGGLTNVDLINRNVAHINSLRQNGAQIDCIADGQTYTVNMQAYFPEEMEGQYDVIFLMAKQRHNEEMVTGLLPYLKADGVICTLQNGLPEPAIAEIVGEARTYGGVASYGAGFVGGSGKVEMTSKLASMRIQIGGYHNDGEKLPLIKEILSYANKETNEKFVVETDNLLGARWAKLSINAAFSGLSVVTGLSFGEIASRHKTRKLALGILRECIDVAQAKGVELEKMNGHDMAKMLGGKSLFKRVIAYLLLPFAMRKHREVRSGMLRDMLSGRKCEVDYINGVVCEEGRKVGVETPLCAKVVELTHGIENGLYELSYRNVDFFEV